MFKKPSLMMRIAMGKTVGFLIGTLGVLFLNYATTIETTLRFDWGIVLWYTTVGAMIGLFGVINYHPLLNLPLPWWFRSAFLGAWLNFVLTFFAYETFEKILIDFLGSQSLWSSPFWFTLEGALVGLLIGFFATSFGGEGVQSVGR
jgi:hypothetical protein